MKKLLLPILVFCSHLLSVKSSSYRRDSGDWPAVGCQVHGSPGGPSLEKKGLRFDGKVLRAEGQAEPPWPMLSCSGWSLLQHAFAPNPIVKFTACLQLLSSCSRPAPASTYT
jgi:hypothetical protein